MRRIFSKNMEQTTPQPSDKPHILYVEDNPLNLLLVQRLLSAEGFVVEGANSADQAFAYLLEQKPDLILMDINLPEIDGYAMTAKIREMAGLESVPIIALTANALKGDRERSLAAGCDGYLQKPIDIDLLPNQLRTFLNRHNGSLT